MTTKQLLKINLDLETLFSKEVTFEVEHIDIELNELETELLRGHAMNITNLLVRSLRRQKLN